MEPNTIAVRLLGGFSVSFGEYALESLPPQAVSLLSYLIVHRERPQTRDLLAGRFWSELPEDRARKRLSNSLWQIKNATSAAGIPELLVATPSSVQVTSDHPISVDSEDFENQLVEFEREIRTRQLRGVLADRLSAVVAEYPGDFLSGHYDDWIEPERARISDRYHGALGHLINLHKSRSQYDVALRFAATLVQQEPAREDLHREVMRLHALLGQASAAQRQFDVCRRVLKSEVGVEPSAETVELMERIKTDAPPPAPKELQADPSSSALIGRSGELALLRGRVDELVNGAGGVVLVEGNPGIGKTRLMEELVEAAEWRGIRVLQAGHSELSKMRPYEALREVLVTTVTGLRAEHLMEVVEPVWLRQAAEVLPELSRLIDGGDSNMPLHPDEEPSRMSEALARVILAQGGLGSTLVVLEDIHWCDDDSMQVLGQLGSRLARSGVLLCLTYRRFEAEQSHSVWSGISKLEALASASRLVVGPLNDAEVRELIAVEAGPAGPRGSSVAELVEQTDGNPLYILESIRNPGNTIYDDDQDDTSLGSLELPATVVKSLERRINALDGEKLAVLRALATLAEPAPSRMVAEIAGLERRITLEALSAVSGQGFVVDDESGICRFTHDQTRRVVYALMQADERAAIHLRIYEAIEREAIEREALQGASTRHSEQLAYHARLAGRMSDAHRWHLVAAQEALAVNGYRTAADHFGQADDAAEELGLDMVVRAKDLLAFESALDVLGRRSEQTMLLKRLREVDLPLPTELALAEREVWLLINTDKPGEGARLALGFIDRAKQAGEAYDGLLTAVAVARYRAGEYKRAVDHATEAMQVATDSAAMVAAETILGKALVDLLDYETGEQHLARAAAEAETIGDHRGKIEALNYQAGAKSRVGRFADAQQLFATTLELSRAIGYRMGEGASLVNLASSSMARGQGGRALEYFADATEVFGSLDLGRGEAFVKLNSANLNHKLLGDDAVAADLASSAAVYFRSVGDTPLECLAMCVLSSVDRRHGRRRLARRRLNDLLARASADTDAYGEVEVRRVLSKLDMDGGDWRAAIVHLDRILELAETYSLETVLPSALANRAYASLMLEDLPRASTFGNRAMELNTADTEETHLTAWLCGTVFHKLGDEAVASAQFSLAHELLTTSLVGVPQDLVERSWSTVQEHVQILEAYERRFVSTVEMQVPAIDAPMGRALHSNEYVDVVLTVTEPQDWTVEQLTKRRQRRIQRLTEEAEEQGGLIRIVDLADALSVSDRTIKRDIAGLRDRGVSLRTRKSS
ncbi:MAG: AAA family ATPase [Acidimicrobiales bacterium]